MHYLRRSRGLKRVASLGTLLCILTVLAACNVRPPTHQHDHSSPGFGDYTGPQDGIWPPQPKGITGVQAFKSAELEGALSAELEAEFVARLSQKGDVRAALGQDYVFLQSEQVSHKGETPRTIAVFYSYSNNQTVEVSEFENKHEIRTFVPNAYQPPEGEQEVTAAVNLAKIKLLEKGYEKAGRLGGGALLAFAGGAAGESGFFHSRVLYVTFASGPDTLPEYFAYVDLTNKSVLEHGPIY